MSSIFTCGPSDKKRSLKKTRSSLCFLGGSQATTLLSPTDKVAEKVKCTAFFDLGVKKIMC